MVLDEQDLRQGLKFIVGTWQVDFVVNAFSNDLAHIPAAEFKSEDGRDFSAITFEFTEDHAVCMKDTATGKESAGTWEQTGYGTFHYTLNDFLEIPDGNFREAAETLNAVDGNLVFAIGFLSIGMKKIAEGTVTEPKDVGDLTPSEANLAMNEIVGLYQVEKTFAAFGDDFGTFTREEAEAKAAAMKAAGTMTDEEIQEAMNGYKMRVEFTKDHRVLNWMPIPAGVSEEDIKAAQEAGEIGEVKDGMFMTHEQVWKAVNGKYYYDTGEHREVFGEVQSSWDELTFDENGLLKLNDMMSLKRL